MERTRPHATATEATAEPVIPGEGFVRAEMTVPREAPDLVNSRLTFNLPSGTNIVAPEGTYTIVRTIGEGNEGVSYLATFSDGKKKVLKVERQRGGKNLEDSLRAEIRRANAALGTDMRFLQLNPIDYAVVRDYAEGESLREYVTRTNRTFTQREALSMIEHVVREYLTPLHAANLVHRDIKPSSLIVSETPDAKKAYTLIDFGLLREDGADATLTRNDVAGTLGYSRFSAEHNFQDDYYGLAETALFSMSDKNPAFIGVPTLDKQDDETKVAKMPMTPAFKELVLRMLGHHGTFSSADEILKQIAQVEKGFNGNADTSIDLVSANELTQYRKRATPPETLLAEIEGLKAIFKEEYDPVKVAKDKPFTGAFYSRLKNTLVRLHYTQLGRTTHDNSELMQDQHDVLIRKRLHDGLVDVVVLKRNSDDYFDYFTAKEGEDLDSRLQYKDLGKKWYQVPKNTVGRLVPIVAGAGLGYLLGDTQAGLITGGVIAGLAGVGAAFASTDHAETDLTTTAWWGIIPLATHHTVGKLYYKMANAVHRSNHHIQVGEDLEDKTAISKALTVAPIYTYDENLVPVTAQPAVVQEAPAHRVRLSNWV